ncbi:hypothetical protein JZ751_011890, partial [Albula glossodonta]
MVFLLKAFRSAEAEVKCQVLVDRGSGEVSVDQLSGFSVPRACSTACPTDCECV